MIEHFWMGMAVIFVGGVLNGGFALPMKYSRRWRWENFWLVFSLVSLVILPWMLALGFVPNLLEVFRGVATRTLMYPLVCGLLLGVAQVTFGLAIKATGIAFAFAVVQALVCLSGSLVPLAVLNPTDLLHPRGILLLVSMPILLLGLLLYATAGRFREKEQAVVKLGSAGAVGNYKKGLVLCIVTGIFGSNFNLGFAFSGRLIRRSLDFGASPVTATFTVWAVVLGAAFLGSLLYCSFLLLRNQTHSLFGQAGWAREVMLAVGMAVLWLGSILAYGIGASLVGRYGPSIGFALFIAASILSANLIGILYGEWKGTSRRVTHLLAGGVAVVLVAVIILNLGGLF